MSVHRQVFFFGGFDPKTPRHYHRLARAAVRERPSEAGEQVQIGPRTAASPIRDEWTLTWQPAEGEPLLTRYAVMRWDDIVLRHWARSPRQVGHDFWQVYGKAAWNGMLGRVRRAAPTMHRLAMTPLVLAAGQIAAVTLPALALIWATPLSPWLVGAGAALAGGLLRRQMGRRLDSEWLLRLYAFTNAQAEGRVPELEQRLDACADELLREVAQSPARELLIVGHSTGAIMAASVLARALRKAPQLGQPGGPQLALLTLGHCTPLLGWQKPAEAFREELALLRQSPALTWWEYTAPADWAAMARVAPWLGEDGPMRRHQASPRFHATMSEAAYQALQRDRRALHLHYLHAPERSGGYDPVTLTAGPRTLAERHAAMEGAPHQGATSAAAKPLAPPLQPARSA